MRKVIFLFLFGFFFIFAGISTAATIEVGPGDSIQAAIESAEAGDDVNVAPGVYYENIDFTDANPCIVHSHDPNDPNIVNQTVIDADGQGRVVTFGELSDPNFFLPPDDPNFKEFGLEGFTITGGVADYGGGIRCDANTVPTIKSCHIVGNSAVDMGLFEGDGGGIYLSSSSAKFINCWIMNNSAEWVGGGVFCEGQAPDGGEGEDAVLPEFFNCIIANNASVYNGGAMYITASEPPITFCTIVGNIGFDEDPLDGLQDWEGGIYCVDDASPTITNSIIWNNGNDLSECEATFSCIEDTDDEGDGVINDTPMFVLGPFSQFSGNYYLSQDSGGQTPALPMSPCVDTGTGTMRDYVDDYIIRYSLGPITTSPVNFKDGGIVDMGYHYNYYYGPPLLRELRIFAIGNGTTNPAPDPCSWSYPIYSVVLITAIPDPNHRVRSWDYNLDNYATTYAVAMLDDMMVYVEFEEIYHSTLNVGGGFQYLAIQNAIDDARDGDTVMIHEGIYPGQGGLDIVGKNITLTGTAPEDANIVAMTVIDFSEEHYPPVLYVTGAAGGSTVVKGITIRNSNTFVLTPVHGEDRPAGSRGFDGGDHFGGGAIGIYGDHIIENCVIQDCNVTGGDADFGWDGDDDVPGGDGGDAGDGGGGGIYIGSGNPVIENCTIENCSATAGNGGAGANGGNLTSGGDGGVPGRAMGAGIYCAAGTQPTIRDCTITGCQVVGGQGGNGGDATGDAGLGGYGGLTTYDPMQGDPDQFTAYGAAIYCETGSVVDIVGCTLSNNVTDGSVSGLGGWAWNGVIQSQPKQNYNIPSFGGGIYGAEGSEVTVEDCQIESNVNTYYNNQYTGYGGGLCFNNSFYAEVVDSNIAGNNSPVGSGLYGKAVSDLQISDSNFVNNTSYVGGGLLMVECGGFGTSVSGCRISGNIAEDPVANIYGVGGGVYSYTSDVTVSDSLISDNSASGSGGGVYLGGDPATLTPSAGNATVKNCLILGNSAGRDGGGITSELHSEPNIINCTIVENEAEGDSPFDVGYGGGIYVGHESEVSVINSILWDNGGPNTIGGNGETGYENGGEIAVGSDVEETINPVLNISYSDVRVGLDGIYLGPDATVNWGLGNISDDPLFEGEYYLSQVAAGQGADSPCVDAGSDTAVALELFNYTTRTDEISDVCTVDMGYHYLITMEMEFTSDFNDDGWVDLFDLAYFTAHWLDSGCGFVNEWCEGTDFNMDTIVNFDDYAIFASSYSPMPYESNAPLPNPAEWLVEPYESSDYIISMTAVEATDESGPVEYYFDCTSGAGTDSGWQESATYQDNVGGYDTYCYTVEVRDVFDNVTSASDPCCVIIQPEDNTAPTPDPSEFAVSPYEDEDGGTYYHKMEAVEATDASGEVWYYFDRQLGDEDDSGWQVSRFYQVEVSGSGIPGMYRVKTKDAYDNESAYSDWEAVQF